MLRSFPRSGDPSHRVVCSSVSLIPGSCAPCCVFLNSGSQARVRRASHYSASGNNVSNQSKHSSGLTRNNFESTIPFNSKCLSPFRSGPIQRNVLVQNNSDSTIIIPVQKCNSGRGNSPCWSILNPFGPSILGSGMFPNENVFRSKSFSFKSGRAHKQTK